MVREAERKHKTEVFLGFRVGFYSNCWGSLRLLGDRSILGGPVEFGKTINESFNFLLNYGGPGRMFGKFL